jgi:hypothetical protein
LTLDFKEQIIVKAEAAGAEFKIKPATPLFSRF